MQAVRATPTPGAGRRGGPLPVKAAARARRAARGAVAPRSGAARGAGDAAAPDTTTPPPPPSLGGVPLSAAASPLPPEQPAPPPPYDWARQWYPVAYAADLPTDSPVRAWLFDEPVAVARRSGGRPPIAFHDACPHRKAALSEGRITAGGAMQCAYHGFTFAGDGTCLGIPHLPGDRVAAGAGAGAGARMCARALPCVEAEGLVWVAPVRDGSPPPDGPPVGIRELNGPDRGRWATADFVRSFPVDASVVLENLCDPDHGLAHQTLSLDAFSAGGPDGKRMTVVQSAGRGGGPHLVGTVPATPVLAAAAAVAGGKKKQKEKKEKKDQGAAPALAPPPATAVLEWEAPGFVRWGRRGPAGEPPKFLATFWVVPEGVGRCKLFIRYARSFATRLPTPRWLVAVGLNAFLDQDTFLVATQQREVLGAEAAAAAAAAAAGGGAGAPPPPVFKRASVLAYRTPSEVFLARLGAFFDAALPHQPNRAAGLRAGLGQGVLDREAVLDRWAGHTAFVPSSRAVHRRAAAAAGALRAVALVAAAAVAAAAGAGRVTLAAAAAWAVVPVVAAAAAWACAHLASRFKFCYTRAAQARDLERIADLAPGVEM